MQARKEETAAAKHLKRNKLTALMFPPVLCILKANTRLSVTGLSPADIYCS